MNNGRSKKNYEMGLELEWRNTNFPMLSLRTVRRF